MLSDDEKQRLHQIERQLEEEEPGFAAEFSRPRAHRPSRGWPYTTLAIVAGLMFLLGCLTGETVLILLGIGGLPAALVARHRRSERRNR
ncbi:DUF3040 domain-containing protein [Amycolatopsis keratiniphila]|uniref:DUF3040 domain-containing protein n=1 Tax=Amycolatopsis keratiniphila subsp. keratiniphila TaxID=227715 RepID=A0A1W2LW20_9PSEU|nr:DUF3040 domain-containing protein [Amycolatopsis keratiniphila]OLZ58105.1 hypothetical protein BS330_12795 [Amycolatopsis keratiniphila subsp. nogabecina]ONF70439.1 hypothetical protein AVR91_0216605 [Amycolatopsis keratiniphila subsp. keratiniphila]SDU44115.1 PEP-CTERM protein-sorting domain-containing protein [Amycolatopsis keratiniphila]